MSTYQQRMKKISTGTGGMFSQVNKSKNDSPIHHRVP
jgi:hypothetical protein